MQLGAWRVLDFACGWSFQASPHKPFAKRGVEEMGKCVEGLRLSGGEEEWSREFGTLFRGVHSPFNPYLVEI